MGDSSRSATDLAREVLAEVDEGRSDARVVPLAREVLRMQEAGREHVERVVRDVLVDAIGNLMWSELDRRHGVARRVADRLCVPVLSTKERAAIKRYIKEARAAWAGDPDVGAVTAVLDRLIAGAKP